MSVASEALKEFIEIVGQKNALTGDATKPYVEERRGRFETKTRLVMRPRSVAEIVEIMKVANKHKVGVIPQGGNTGLVGAGVPNVGDDNSVIVSVGRLKKIIQVDEESKVMVVEAGVILKNVQEEAEKRDLLFPLSLSAEGSCQIGGNIATNAGGTNTLKYGTMRDLTLGLEVVLPTGEVMNLLSKLRKDNTGYDLKNLFIGAEGTLGIITKASLKLFAQPKSVAVGMVGINTPQDAVDLLNHALQTADVTGAEIMNALSVRMATRNGTKKGRATGMAIGMDSPWHVLLEIVSVSADSAQDMLETLLTEALELGIARDGVVAQSKSHQREVWGIRHNISDSQKREGASVKNDVAVPVNRIPEFLREADEAVTALVKDARIVAFGHIGDGNIHYNISQPPSLTASRFLDYEPELHRTINDLAKSHNGTFAAEHGIGQMKRERLAQTKDPTAYQTMKKIKTLLDPNNIMNPKKIFLGVEDSKK